jgi:hypothetical protein
MRLAIRVFVFIWTRLAKLQVQVAQFLGDHIDQLKQRDRGVQQFLRLGEMDAKGGGAL